MFSDLAHLHHWFQSLSSCVGTNSCGIGTPVVFGMLAKQFELVSAVAWNPPMGVYRIFSQRSRDKVRDSKFAPNRGHANLTKLWLKNST